MAGIPAQSLALALCVSKHRRNWGGGSGGGSEQALEGVERVLDGGGFLSDPEVVTPESMAEMAKRLAGTCLLGSGCPCGAAAASASGHRERCERVLVRMSRDSRFPGGECGMAELLLRECLYGARPAASEGEGRLSLLRDRLYHVLHIVETLSPPSSLLSTFAPSVASSCADFPPALYYWESILRRSR